VKLDTQTHDETVNTNAEVAIIGAGPGGYETAIRLHQKGIKVILFEKEKLGGECLNWGCIPTKAMVKSADLFSEIKHSSEFGIDVENISLDFTRFMERKSKVVEKLTTGLDYIFNKRKIPVFYEQVKKISKRNEYQGRSRDKEHDNQKSIFIIETKSGKMYQADFVVVATGSKPIELPGLPFDSHNILSSRDILEITELPKHLAIIGGGTIGCEFASIFSSLGVKVEIIELLPSLLSNEDKDISRKLTTAFKKKGIRVHVKTMVEGAQLENGKVILKLVSTPQKQNDVNNEDTKVKELITDKVLVSTGRKACCDIDFSGLRLVKNDGKIEIDDFMETAEKKIYAIGDVTGKLMLAHTASKQGLLVADYIEQEIKGNNNMMAASKHHQKPLLYYNIPRCTYTDPEVASIGITDHTAVKNGKDVLVGRFSYLANGKALAIGSKDGIIKVVADKNNRKVIGMHIVGKEATELIVMGSIIINTGLTIDDLHHVIYAHPTISEILMEAIEDLEDLAIHKI